MLTGLPPGNFDTQNARTPLETEHENEGVEHCCLCCIVGSFRVNAWRVRLTETLQMPEEHH